MMSTALGLHRHTTSVIAIICIAIVLVCGEQAAVANNDHDHRHHDHFAQLAKAPEKLRAEINPFAGNGDARLAGRKLFTQHCAECHGSIAEGGRKAPSLRAAEVQQAPPGTLFWIVTNGVVRRGMPVWSKLPEAQRWQIVTYIQSLGLHQNLQTRPTSRSERNHQE